MRFLSASNGSIGSARFIGSVRSGALLVFALFVMAGGPLACSLDTRGAQASVGAGAGEGSSSGASASSGSSSSTSSSGAVDPEDCTDGVDNDGNGDVDCADAACTAGYTCVDAIPSGWVSVWVREAPYDPSATPPTCPEGSTLSVYYVDPAATTECGECSCTFAGATCSTPSFGCWYNNDCGNMPIPLQYTDTNCRDFGAVPGLDNGGSCKILADPYVTSAGTCTGTPSDVTGPPLWGKQVYVCSTPAVASKGCDGTQVCLPKATGDFEAASTCLVQAGADKCPAGWTTAEIPAFEGATDDRACSDCACDTSTVTCIGGGVNIYDSDGCGSFDSTISSFNCVNISNVFDSFSASFKGILGTPVDGTCAPPQPLGGTVTTTGPQRLCCR